MVRGSLRRADDLQLELSGLLVPRGPDVGLVLLSPDLSMSYEPQRFSSVESMVSSLQVSALRRMRSDTTRWFHLDGAQCVAVAAGSSQSELVDLALALYRRSYSGQLAPTACAVVREPQGELRATPFALMMRAWRLVRGLGPGVSTEWGGLIGEDGSTDAGVRAPLPPTGPRGHLKAEADHPRDDEL